jgi:predicted glycoside hydrolase/deacetylase ChbG (UPF0249 family)
MNVIFHADDAGVSYGTNEAIIQAHKIGVLTSTSIRTNGVCFSDMVKKLKENKQIGIGIHLNLTDGTPHIPELSNRQELYKHSFFSYFVRLQILKDKELLSRCIKELEFEFRMIAKTGLTIDHVDGQDHIHMIPVLWNETMKLCKKHNINKIRVSYEPMHYSGFFDLLRMIRTGGVLKRAVLSILSRVNKRSATQNGFHFPEAFYGVLYTSKMDTQAVKASIIDAKKRKYKTIEIALHPAFPHYNGESVFTSPYFAFYSNNKARQREFETLTDPILASFIKAKNLTLTTFASL